MPLVDNSVNELATISIQEQQMR